jgi:hypothetical protein
MRPLVDFSPRPPATPAGVALLFAGCAAVVAVAAFAWNAQQRAAASLAEVQAAERRLQAVDDGARAAQAAARAQVQRLESDERLRELHLPWGRLFAALESAQIKVPVKLMFVDPAAGAGTVQVDAQAADLATAARYVEALVAGGLAEATITQHRSAFGESAAPGVVFTATGRWHEGQ